MAKVQKRVKKLTGKVELILTVPMLVKPRWEKVIVSDVSTVTAGATTGSVIPCPSTLSTRIRKDGRRCFVLWSRSRKGVAVPAKISADGSRSGVSPLRLYI